MYYFLYGGSYQFGRKFKFMQILCSTLRTVQNPKDSNFYVRFPKAPTHRNGTTCNATDLYVLLHPDQALFQRVEAGGVEHLFLDLGRVGTPRHQDQLLLLGGVGGTLALVLVLEVVKAVPAVVGAAHHDVCEELVVVAVPGAWKDEGMS